LSTGARNGRANWGRRDWKHYRARLFGFVSTLAVLFSLRLGALLINPGFFSSIVKLALQVCTAEMLLNQGLVLRQRSHWGVDH
jgi:hypothetical protein